MRKSIFLFMIFFLLLSTGCGDSKKEAVESLIQEAFKVRADAVFLYKDKAALNKYFQPQALEQSKDMLAWKPKGEWNNAKDLKYSYSIRIDKLKIDGKVARAEVRDTAIVSWEYVEPAGTKVEDAWSNRKHLVTLTQSEDGLWVVDQDIIEK